MSILNTLLKFSLLINLDIERTLVNKTPFVFTFFMIKIVKIHVEIVTKQKCRKKEYLCLVFLWCINVSDCLLLRFSCALADLPTRDQVDARLTIITSERSRRNCAGQIWYVDFKESRALKKQAFSSIMTDQNSENSCGNSKKTKMLIERISWFLFGIFVIY